MITKAFGSFFKRLCRLLTLPVIEIDSCRNRRPWLRLITTQVLENRPGYLIDNNFRELRRTHDNPRLIFTHERVTDIARCRSHDSRESVSVRCRRLAVRARHVLMARKGNVYKYEGNERNGDMSRIEKEKVDDEWQVGADDRFEQLLAALTFTSLAVRGGNSMFLFFQM